MGTQTSLFGKGTSLFSFLERFIMVCTLDCAINRGSRTKSRMNGARKSERSRLVEHDPALDLRTIDTGQQGHLVLLPTAKKPRRNQGIVLRQGGRQAANFLDTQHRHPLAMHAEWFQWQMNHAGEPGDRTGFPSPLRSIVREKVGGAESSGGTLTSHPDRSSSDDGDESSGDNEAEESHQCRFWRQLSGIMRKLTRSHGAA
jgi:hypothetical protein